MGCKSLSAEADMSIKLSSIKSDTTEMSKQFPKNNKRKVHTHKEIVPLFGEFGKYRFF